MDDAQTDHLKAYGLTYRAIQAGLKAEWLLNYRGGSFLIPDLDALRRDAALNGIRVEPVDSGITAIRGEIEANNMDAVPLEKAPKMAVYAPPNAAPWDDAVTMALQYAGVPFTKIWDAEVMNGGLRDYDWLHLHHEDFTGQYSKFFLIYSGLPWLAEMVQRNSDMARRLGFGTVLASRGGVRSIRGYVESGGFSCVHRSRAIDLALAARCRYRRDLRRWDAARSNATKLDWCRRLRSQGRTSAGRSSRASPSTAAGQRRLAAPAAGRVQAVQLQRQDRSGPHDAGAESPAGHPDFYGLTTSFTRNRLKPGVTILAEEEGAPWVKYIHGDLGKGTWTFFGGHDPEDPQHQIGDPATDLSLHPHSPGYRLILNNVLFPAAKKRELKT
jgi:hypothetical protein